LKYISSILLLFVLNTSFAQKPERDYIPSAIRLGVDAFGLLKSGFNSDFKRMEGQVDIDLHHLFFAIDYGYEKNSSSGDNFNYENWGTYYRIGLQANIQPYNVNRNVMFFGFRYAKSNFQDKLEFVNTTNNFGDTPFSFVNDNLSAKWFEINLGMKIKIVDQLYFGYTIRFKFAQSLSGEGQLTPREIPGYGKSDKKSAAGFNYYIAYRFPFRNKSIPIKPKYQPKSTD